MMVIIYVMTVHCDREEGWEVGRRGVDKAGGCQNFRYFCGRHFLYMLPCLAVAKSPSQMTAASVRRYFFIFISTSFSWTFGEEPPSLFTLVAVSSLKKKSHRDNYYALDKSLIGRTKNIARLFFEKRNRLGNCKKSFWWKRADSANIRQFMASESTNSIFIWWAPPAAFRI